MKTEKLRMDLSGAFRLGVYMDDIDHELIALLGTRIGMIMEDTSSAALRLSAIPSNNIQDEIEIFVRNCDRLRALAGALSAITK